VIIEGQAKMKDDVDRSATAYSCELYIYRMDNAFIALSESGRCDNNNLSSISLIIQSS
jgi:hypothetical protein